VRDDAGRLQDILTAIVAIEEYVGKGRWEFDQNRVNQVWIVHHLLIVGEAARGLSEELRGANPDVPWSDIIAMRNLLIHEYFGIDRNEVWSTAVNDLPILRRHIEGMLVRLRDSNS
jgi:uncharacterized protein with HEPN domain